MTRRTAVWLILLPLILTACSPAGRVHFDTPIPRNVIYFAPDAVSPRREDLAVIDGWVRWLKDNPDFGVLIEGHTGLKGTLEYNMALGQRLADSVRGQLEAAGISRGRLRTMSLGENQPVDENNDDLNRRVVIIQRPLPELQGVTGG